MAIPEEQCARWANPGAGVTLQASHETIRLALAAPTSPIRDLDYDVFLQGSYKNDTNVRGDSDVDVVVRLNSTVFDNAVALPLQQARGILNTVPPAIYRWEHFDTHVQLALRSRFGANNVHPKNKCITVRGGSGRLDADVIVALKSRNYYPDPANGTPVTYEGIAFWTREEQPSRAVVNYPELHYRNGIWKNARTNGLYKPTVRMFKNARRYMIERHLLAEGTTPSYFVECLLFNAPHTLFVPALDARFRQITEWMVQADLVALNCQNQMLPLFGASPEQWNTAAAEALAEALRQLWNEWS